MKKPEVPANIKIEAQALLRNETFKYVIDSIMYEELAKFAFADPFDTNVMKQANIRYGLSQEIMHMVAAMAKSDD